MNFLRRATSQDFKTIDDMPASAGETIGALHSAHSRARVLILSPRARASSSGGGQ